MMVLWSSGRENGRKIKSRHHQDISSLCKVKVKKTLKNLKKVIDIKTE